MHLLKEGAVDLARISASGRAIDAESHREPAPK
jgi:hypothetical protein